MLKLLYIILAMATCFNTKPGDFLQHSEIEIHVPTTETEINKLLEVLETRNGEIIIEVTEGTVIDANGNGIDCNGCYIHYDNTEFSTGDTVITVFIYNPENNFIDDIIYRADFLKPEEKNYNDRNIICT